MGGSALNSAADKYFLDAHLFKLWVKHGHKHGYLSNFAKFAHEVGIGMPRTNAIRLKVLVDAGKIKFTPLEDNTAARARELILGELKGKQYKSKALAVRELAEKLDGVNPNLVKKVLDELLEEGIVSVEQIANDLQSRNQLRRARSMKKSTK